MAERKEAELVVIGAGPGGYAAAFRAADLGVEVTLIDPEANPGGVCLYRGCIPSKSLLHLAKIKQETEEAEKWGVTFEEPTVDLEKVNNWKNQIIDKLTSGLGKLTENRKIEYIRGKAKFDSEKTLQVENQDGGSFKLTFQKAIIATGSLPVNLPEIEFDHEVIIDSADALQISKIPENMLIIGGGYIGLELGSVYAAFGCKVSVAEMTAGFLPGADRDLVAIFEKQSRRLFESVYFETKVEKVAVEEGKATVTLTNKKGDQEKVFDKVLMAVGRKPNSASLNLEKANLETDDKGFIKVDSQRRTNVEHIFAIGDITGEPLLAHKATHEGRLAAEVIAGKKGAAFDPKSIPGIVYTNPEIAWCGLTETQAKEKGMDVKICRFDWPASGKAAIKNAENGLTKLIFDSKTGRILGGGVAGKDAGILIPQISLAIEMSALAREIAFTAYPHPTLSETIKEAAQQFSGKATHETKD